MDVRQVCSPLEAKGFDTNQLRANFLVEDLFAHGKISMAYSHLDRTVVGGVVPIAGALQLESNKQIGSENFLDRREIGIINIGAAGTIEADGSSYELASRECLYLPMGTVSVIFSSATADDPAEFYFISTPAHHAFPAMKITEDDANCLELGASSDANVRILRQYIHPDVCKSCQLVMGITTILDGSVWNTMPCHTHDRRSEVYLYFDMNEETRVFHFMGEPTETRHLVMKEKQAVLSPGWSIHSGAGTGRYSFIWSMAGDNQDFTDMDFVAMKDLR
ncbi:5-dehydro-4-deoxy-D-glucuronate isomerase [Labrenzia sp. PHM005]|uniref:5-dehydro-4-deoxy-D-glucuronate isomerase n=1 Tax=Labrenzia sp. PHM005 TaxID=2590016 RepID=UPI00114089C1|nr:5-dehydro-4-deoxy-D-glucuronate isomerase [Labrenzia sp. PHM005]QDG76019.1 5-dehydro-4-deoxy-D-glucuronate isomerase [Labrenzia sp. PHM005]